LELLKQKVSNGPELVNQERMEKLAGRSNHGRGIISSSIKIIQLSSSHGRISSSNNNRKLQSQ
jgi:hypothetical protein